MNPLAVTFWPAGYAVRHGDRQELTWPELVHNAAHPRVIATKEAAPGWSFAVGRENRRRRCDIELLTAIVLDVDVGSPGALEAAAAALAGLRCVLHTTWSHAPAAPRFRV